jgi:hypothetical protein
VLPDGLFSKQKKTIWIHFRRSCTGRWWYFYFNFVYFPAKWYIYGQLVHYLVIQYSLPRFGMLYLE